VENRELLVEFEINVPDGTSESEVSSRQDAEASAGTSPRAPPATSGVDLPELADRVSDIERRLARIEAELGALR